MRPAASPPAGLGNLVSASDVIGALRRHLWMIILLFIVVSGAGIALTVYLWIAKPVYQAEAYIKVSPGYMGSRAAGGVETRADVLPSNLIEQFINSQVSLVRSDAVLRMALDPTIYKRIISDLDPASERIMSGSGAAAERDANTELRRRTERIAKNLPLLLGSSEAKVVRLKKKIDVRNPYRTMYIRISLVGRERQLIADVVNNVAESYMLAYRDDRKLRERTLMSGLKLQRKELRGPLESAARALNELRKQAGAISLGGNRLDVAGELRFYEQERAKVGLELIAAQLLERQLLQAPDAEGNEVPLQAKPTPEMEFMMQGDATLGRLRDALAALAREKGILAGQGYGPGHRMVIANEAQIKRTEEEIKARETELISILVRRQAEEIKGRVAGVTEQYRAINQRYNEARAKAQELVKQAVAYERLNRQYESLQNHMDMINQAIIQQSIESEVSANSVSIQEPATRPEVDDKAGPSLMVYIPGCVILGLVISIGLALLVELIDNRVRTPLQVIRNVQMTVLGTVPDRKEDAATSRLEDLSLVTTQAPQSLMAESFRQLRTALLYSTDTELKTLLVTSPRAGEGKSTVASNLAITLAASGCRVLLVDTNFRQPMVHRAFDLPNSIGLSSVLARLNSFDEATQSTTIANLDCLCCGPVPPSPADLLGSEAMQNLLAEAQQKYDNVILDGTPVLVVTDAHVLCGMVDGVAMVISSSQTPRGVALRTKRMLLGFRARLLGAVLNRVRAQKGGYFREAYKSYYDYAGGAAASPAAPRMAASRSSDAASAMDSPPLDLSGRDEGDTGQDQPS
ncbi:MAG: polysaccharide biosynthesis tyrosine autokinase [Anaerolineaceae bacterium]|nr:polysaccharide biosynthesis tyrosine autokinase [Anaerolineaceae bacterium]